MKNNLKQYLPLLVLFLVFVITQYQIPKKLDKSRTYGLFDKIPYGSNALYQLMKQALFKDSVECSNKTPYQQLEAEKNIGNIYFMVGNNLPLGKADCRAILKFAENGNDAFIGANYFPTFLEDTLSFSVKPIFNIAPNSDSAPQKFQFYPPQAMGKRHCEFKSQLLLSSFSKFDSSKTVILATTLDSQAVLLRFPIGRGNIYLFSLPDAFSNIILKEKSQREFAYHILSYLKGGKIIWKNNQKEKDSHPASLMDFIFNNPSLYTGYMIALIFLLIFMGFALKRKQRIIPEIPPLRNTTLDFIEVLGKVYYRHKNHKIILEEKALIFFEQLRTQFGLKNKSFKPDDISRIAALSGIPEAEVRATIHKLLRILQGSSVSEFTLTSMNEELENFNKKNKRKPWKNSSPELI